MSDYIRGLRQRIGTTVLEVPTVSVIVHDERERALLVRHVEGSVWTTPGGMIEPYELPADAALREMWEETGLTVALDRIVGVFGGPPCSAVYGNGDQVAFVSTVFTARVVGGTPRPDGEETLELAWFARDELDGAPIRPHVRLYLDAAWARDSAPRFQPPTWKPPRG